MSTTTQQIPQAHWLEYFSYLNRIYEGWWVTIEALGTDLGDQRLAQGVLLQGLSYETQGSEKGNILIEAGDLPSDFMVHHISRPRNVWVADLLPGFEADIQIEAEDGLVTIVRLRRRPELPPGSSPPSHAW